MSPEHLIAAVRMVRSGDALLAPITRRLVERYAGQQPSAAEVSADLSGADPARARGARPDRPGG